MNKVLLENKKQIIDWFSDMDCNNCPFRKQCDHLAELTGSTNDSICNVLNWDIPKNNP